MEFMELEKYFDQRYGHSNGHQEHTHQDAHAEIDGALRSFGISDYTCKNCGPKKIGENFSDDYFHECDNCDANRVFNGLKKCPFCGENQEEN